MFFNLFETERKKQRSIALVAFVLFFFFFAVYLLLLCIAVKPLRAFGHKISQNKSQFLFLSREDRYVASRMFRWLANLLSIFWKEKKASSDPYERKFDSFVPRKQDYE